jgi:hypothetical protein
MLYDFMQKKDQVLANLPSKLPTYSVPWIKSHKKCLEVQPQVSFFQVPLLQFAPEVADRMKDSSKYDEQTLFMNKKFLL